MATFMFTVWLLLLTPLVRMRGVMRMRSPTVMGKANQSWSVVSHSMARSVDEGVRMMCGSNWLLFGS